MTRFARAKGSKSSNEKVPEDGTPWEVMKDQLLQAKKNCREAKSREEAEQNRIQNYENFLKEHKVQKRKATWCDFPEAESTDQTKEKKQNADQPHKKKKKKGKSNKNDNEVVEYEKTKKSNTALVSNENPSLKKSIKKKKNKTNCNVTPSTTETQLQLADSSAQSFVKKSMFQANDTNADTNKEIENVVVSKTDGTGKESKKHKSNKANQNQHTLSNVATENSNRHENIKNTTATKQNKMKKKNKKLIDGKPVRRKQTNDNSFQLIINGKEVQLIRYDGFPIMKKDAERLTELKKSMIQKGIPKSEVQRTMKLERRRAEKALARVKRDVCYNCRRGGHNLSDCPELKSKIPGADAAEGVCFKCGSTEHRQFECKVQRDKEFRFATCFICKQQGHIARQCPDNPKGLYPNGGGCKLCGDVTHLRKDCPTANDKKEGKSVKLQTLGYTEHIEDIDGQEITSIAESNKKPKKIKF